MPEEIKTLLIDVSYDSGSTHVMAQSQCPFCKSANFFRFKYKNVAEREITLPAVHKSLCRHFVVFDSGQHLFRFDKMKTIRRGEG